MLRSTEAIMAGLLILFALQHLVKIPEVEIEDPIRMYIISLLDSYSQITKEIVFKDPYALIQLLEAGLPYAYNARITVNIYKKVYTTTGLNLTLPVETYEVLPAEARTTISNSEVIGNWYQARFAVENNGNEDLSNLWEKITVALYKVDINSDGIPEPIDPLSITVFTDEGKADYEILSIEDYRDRDVVSLNVKINHIGAGERKNIYVMYLVGDDYE